jgi:hypothetical protein
MNRLSKMVLISGGGTIVLIVGGMMIAALMGTSTEQVREVNLIRDWFFYRIIFYSIIVLSWSYLSKKWADHIIERSPKIEESQREELAKAIGKRRYHVAALFAFFEIVLIQQLGTIAW